MIEVLLLLALGGAVGFWFAQVMYAKDIRR